jgi:plasmid stabilization system protein ParE
VFKGRLTEEARDDLLCLYGFGGLRVALFEIDDARTVTVLAVRHQREQDSH